MSWRRIPKNTEMMQGFKKMFLQLSLKFEVVKREMPAVHMAIRLGMMKMEA